MLGASVAVLIVGFRNPGDVVGCLRSLSRAAPEPSFDVFIAENGGAPAMESLVGLLGAADSPCRPLSEPGLPGSSPDLVRRRLFRLMRPDGTAGGRVHVAEMRGNLGYAGGVNAWLRLLLRVPGWEGAWILNPDTEPAPTALAELVACAADRGKGMVGSCLTPMAEPTIVHSRGLRWRNFVAKTLAVDRHAPILPAPDPADVENRLVAPSGASMYVTRALIEKIGLMDERYFLYFEDLEWGCRAKRLNEVGYAHRSVVAHKGGTTIGSAGRRAAMSPLSVYLETRNRILFVRDKHPAWLPWVIAMQVVHSLLFGTSGAFTNLRFAFRGLVAGIVGENGRPDRVFDEKARQPAVQRQS